MDGSRLLTSCMPQVSPCDVLSCFVLFIKVKCGIVLNLFFRKDCFVVSCHFSQRLVIVWVCSCATITINITDTISLLRGNAWTAEVLVRNNDAHPWVECSNRGECDRDTG